MHAPRLRWLPHTCARGAAAGWVCARALHVLRVRRPVRACARYAYEELPSWGHADDAFVMHALRLGMPVEDAKELFFKTRQACLLRLLCCACGARPESHAPLLAQGLEIDLLASAYASAS